MSFMQSFFELFEAEIAKRGVALVEVRLRKTEFTLIMSADGIPGALALPNVSAEVDIDAWRVLVDAELDAITSQMKQRRDAEPRD